MKCTLQILDSAMNVKPFEFDREEITIGRIPGNDIVINDMSISRHHAMVIEREGQFELIDLDSKNGVKHNGVKVRSALLCDQDKIEIGNVLLQFSCDALSTICLAEDNDKAPGDGETIIAGQYRDVREIPKLLIASGEETGKEYLIDRDLLTIGRSEDNDIILDDPLVSRHHAQVVLNSDNTVSIKDTDSGNGTFVNGKKRDKIMLLHGDKIQIGKTTFSFAVKGINIASDKIEGEKREETPIEIKISRPVLLAFSLIIVLVIGFFLIRDESGEKDVGQAPVAIHEQTNPSITDKKETPERTNSGEDANTFQHALKMDAEKSEISDLINEVNKRLQSSAQPKHNVPSVVNALDVYAQGRPDSAISMLKEILGSSENRKEAKLTASYIAAIEGAKESFERGTGLYNKKDAGGAFAEWKETLLYEKELPLTRKSRYAGKIASAAADELYRKGVESSHRGDRSRAVRSWKKAIEVVPNHEDALSGLEDIAGKIYSEGNALKDVNRQAALQKWQEVLTIAPPGSDYYDRAQAQLNLYK